MQEIFEAFFFGVMRAQMLKSVASNLKPLGFFVAARLDAGVEKVTQRFFPQMVGLMAM